VLAAALSFGFGDLIVPDIFTHLFDGVHAGKGLQGLLNSITIILSTPCEHIVILIAGLELTTPLKSLIRWDSSHNIESYLTTGGLVPGRRWSRQGRSKYRRRERYPRGRGEGWLTEFRTCIPLVLPVWLLRFWC
jgi:hypothetical protein